VTIKEAYEQLKKEVPTAEYIHVGVDVSWWPCRGDDVEIEYTVAVIVYGHRCQQSCVADLDAAVRTVIGEINGPKPTDLSLLDAGLSTSREVAAMQDIHGADGLAEMSNDQG
jgi:hypothetical protein